MPTIEEKFSDIPQTAASFSLLAGLSKYADIAATSLMRGRQDAKNFTGFMDEVEEIYPALRERILDSIVSDEDRAAAAVFMRPLRGDKDVLRASLVLDQAHTFVQALLNGDSVASQIRLNSMRVEMEENSLREQFEASTTKSGPNKQAMYL